jgi:hypothetical protein
LLSFQSQNFNLILSFYLISVKQGQVRHLLIIINLIKIGMEENKNNSQGEKGGGLGPVLIISVVLIGIILILKMITG